MYFTKEYLSFFKALEKNNNKEWFHDNKKSYEEHVRKPMLALVGDLIVEMQKTDEAFNPDPKKCLSRINRDIRFSKDKTPYNTHLWAHITKGSKMDPLPGIAFRFTTEDAGVMSGFYNPPKERLLAIRNIIKNDHKTFKKLRSSKKFIDSFQTIKGEANKRIPPEFKELFETEPLIANKQFYYINLQKADFVTSKNLKKDILNLWKAAKPLNDFLSGA